MAVPKRKTSKSKRNQRRSHLGLKAINSVIDKESGEYTLSHHICDGKYKGRQVVMKKAKNTTKDEAPTA